MPYLNGLEMGVILTTTYIHWEPILQVGERGVEGLELFAEVGRTTLQFSFEKFMLKFLLPFLWNEEFVIRYVYFVDYESWMILGYV